MENGHTHGATQAPGAGSVVDENVLQPSSQSLAQPNKRRRDDDAACDERASAGAATVNKGNAQARNNVQAAARSAGAVGTVNALAGFVQHNGGMFYDNITARGTAFVARSLRSFLPLSPPQIFRHVATNYAVADRRREVLVGDGRVDGDGDRG